MRLSSLLATGTSLLPWLLPLLLLLQLVRHPFPRGVPNLSRESAFPLLFSNSRPKPLQPFFSPEVPLFPPLRSLRSPLKLLSARRECKLQKIPLSTPRFGTEDVFHSFSFLPLKIRRFRCCCHHCCFDYRTQPRNPGLLRGHRVRSSSPCSIRALPHPTDRPPLLFSLRRPFQRYLCDSRLLFRIRLRRRNRHLAVLGNLQRSVNCTSSSSVPNAKQID